jgi:hypothetical protein
MDRPIARRKKRLAKKAKRGFRGYSHEPKSRPTGVTGLERWGVGLLIFSVLPKRDDGIKIHGIAKVVSLP